MGYLLVFICGKFWKRWEYQTIRTASYLTYMQSTSWETLGWRKDKLKSRLPGEISITSGMQMTPPYGRKWRTKEPLDKSEQGEWKSWWWTGKPGMLQFMVLQRVGHDSLTKLNWTDVNYEMQPDFRAVKMWKMCC